MPFFTGDTNQIILRIKEKFISSLNLIEFEKKAYDADLVFESYCFKNAEDSEISGYMCKALSIKLSDVQVIYMSLTSKLKRLFTSFIESFNDGKFHVAQRLQKPGVHNPDLCQSSFVLLGACLAKSLCLRVKSLWIV